MERCACSVSGKALPVTALAMKSEAGVRMGAVSQNQALTLINNGLDTLRRHIEFMLSPGPAGGIHFAGPLQAHPCALAILYRPDTWVTKRSDT